MQSVNPARGEYADVRVYVSVCLWGVASRKVQNEASEKVGLLTETNVIQSFVTAEWAYQQQHVECLHCRWLDTLIGPGGLVLATALGLLHVMPGNPNNVVDLIPVDYVINCIIGSAWYTATHRRGGPEKK